MYLKFLKNKYVLLKLTILNGTVSFWVFPSVTFYICYSCSNEDCHSRVDEKLFSKLYVWLFVHASLWLIWWGLGHQMMCLAHYLLLKI